jgi:hypothetical protein
MTATLVYPNKDTLWLFALYSHLRISWVAFIVSSTVAPLSAPIKVLNQVEVHHATLGTWGCDKSALHGSDKPLEYDLTK